MTKSELLDIIASPSSVDKDVLRDLQDYVKEYPYSQTFRMLYLKGLDNTQDVRYGNELKTTSLYVTDRRNLYRFISDKPQAQVKEQRQNSISLREVPKMETESVDAGDKTEAVAPIVDIQSYLQGKEDDSLSGLAASINDKPKPQLKHQDLIDNFLQASESSDIYVRMDKPDGEEEPVVEFSKPIQEDARGEQEEFFTETLARIYIKQHKFDKAIKIFKRLSLKYPEKSIYFADQIRFFEKLIQNYKIRK